MIYLTGSTIVFLVQYNNPLQFGVDHLRLLGALPDSAKVLEAVTLAPFAKTVLDSGLSVEAMENRIQLSQHYHIPLALNSEDHLPDTDWTGMAASKLVGVVSQLGVSAIGLNFTGLVEDVEIESMVAQAPRQGVPTEIKFAVRLEDCLLNLGLTAAVNQQTGQRGVAYNANFHHVVSPKGGQVVSDAISAVVSNRDTKVRILWETLHELQGTVN